MRCREMQGAQSVPAMLLRKTAVKVDAFVNVEKTPLWIGPHFTRHKSEADERVLRVQTRTRF
jgi:hypothetical protein